MTKKIAVFSAEGLALEALLENWQESGLEACSPFLFHEDLVGETVLFNQRPIAFQSSVEVEATEFDLIIALDVDTEQQAWFDKADCPILASITAIEVLSLAKAQCIANAELLALQLLLGNTPCKIKGTVLLPASIHGKKGVDALASQTISLLSGKSVKRGALKQQLSFNAFPLNQKEYQQSIQKQVQLAAIGQEVDLAAIQVSVFHGLGMQLWLELAEEALAIELIEQWRKTPDFKINKSEVGASIYAACQEDALLQIGQITLNQTNKNEINVWLAFDDVQIFINQVLNSASQLLLKLD